jgi:hypothetical protein
MTTRKKVVLVLVGYLLALFVAFAVVQVYIWNTSGPDRQTYGVMFAFGDDLLFLAVLGVASLPATAAALYFLRAYRPVWTALSLAAVGLAVTGLAALLAILAPPTISPHSSLQMWADLSPIRALVAPLFAMACLLAGLLAPSRSPRITLLLVAASEAAVFAFAFLHWAHPSGVG